MRKDPNFSEAHIEKKIHEFYHKLGYLPIGKELQVLKSEIGIRRLAIKRIFKKQFELHFKSDNAQELRAKCNKCGVIKKLTDFRSVKKSIYGIGECNDCSKQYRKELDESNPGLKISYPWKEYRDRYFKKHGDTAEYKIRCLNKQLLVAKKQSTIDKIHIKIADLKNAEDILNVSH